MTAFRFTRSANQNCFSRIFLDGVVAAGLYYMLSPTK
jgi:hypothetical protein